MVLLFHVTLTRDHSMVFNWYLGWAVKSKMVHLPWLAVNGRKEGLNWGYQCGIFALPIMAVLG